MINGKLIRSKKQFLGSLIGDHTKTAIGTKINTGTKIEPVAILFLTNFHQETYYPSLKF